MGTKSLSSINFKLRADIKHFSTGLQNAQRKMKKFAKKMDRMGKNMTRNFTAPILAMGTGVVYAAANFEKAMNQVRAVTGATGKDFEALKDQAKELGKTTQFSASQAAEAMGFLGMAGFNTNQILAAMPATLDLAAAGGLELAEAADIASNVLSGFGVDASELGRYSDVMTKGFTSSNQSLSMLGAAMAEVAPVASGFGLSVEETTAAIGLLSNAGIQGGKAGTSLKNILVKLDEESTNLGLSIYDAAGNMLPLAVQMEQLEAKGLSTSDVMGTFKKIAGPGMLAMLKQGSKGLRDLTTELENSGGTAKEVAETQMEGLTGTITRLKSATEGVAIQFGDMLLPVMEKLAGRLQKVLTWLSNLSAKTKENIIRVATLTAVIGPLLIVVSKITLGLQALTGVLLAVGPSVIMFTTYIKAMAVAGFKANGMIGAMSNVLRTLKMIIKANILGTLLTVLAAGVGLWMAFRDKNKEANTELNNTATAAKTAAERLAEINDELDRSGKSHFELLREEIGKTLEPLIEKSKKLQDRIAELNEVLFPASGMRVWNPELQTELAALTEEFNAVSTNVAGYYRALAKLDEKEKQVNDTLEITTTNLKEVKTAFQEMIAALALSNAESSFDWINDIQRRDDDIIPIEEADEEDEDVDTSLGKKLLAIKKRNKEILAEFKGMAQAMGEEVTLKFGQLNDKILEFVATWGEAIFAAFSVIGQGLANASAALDNYHAKESRAIENSIMTAKQKADAQEALDKDVADKRRKLQRKQAIADKVAAMISAAINGWQAITKVAAQTGVGSVIAVPIMKGLIAAQIALIAAAPIPQFAQGGIVSGPTVGLMGEYPGARTNPEVIAPLDKLKSMIGDSGGTTTIIPDVTIKGEDISISFERYNRRKARR